MGRRKIEIKAIRDDRNRSVTFLKRKYGLFKKAHELSVLCSVDIAVIIFGQNKKLYEFSSGDIRETLNRYQYWGPPHEHKGPNDFIGKGGGDDDDDDDDISVTEDVPSQTQNMVPPHLQNQQHGFQQHVNHTSSASPPIPNGAAFDPRHGTPQPQVGSRPSSRNHLQRVGSMSSQTHPHGTPTPPQNGFTYVPAPPMYNPNVNVNQQGSRPTQYSQYPHPTPGPQQQPLPHTGQTIAQQHQQPQSHAPHAPHHLAHQQPASQSQHQHLPQQYIQDQGRQSMPPTFPPEQAQSQSSQYQQPSREPRQLPQLTVQTNADETPSSPAPHLSNAKSRSIFTPIDDQGSVLARFGGGPPLRDSPQQENLRPEPSQPTAAKNMAGPGPIAIPPQPTRAATAPQRIRAPAVNPTPPPPVRSNTAQSNAKRPRLTVQIPSEQSDGGGSATADSSPHESTAVTATPARTKSDPTHTGVVLPPPSPSAGALLSAGAQGPPNPFARPPPPGTGTQNGSYGGNNLDTPISALPSRFVSDALLPSPSSFFPEWGFGRSGPDTNMLPSPLTFPTPAAQAGPGFSRDDEGDRKRKSLEGANGAEAVGKKVKT